MKDTYQSPKKNLEAIKLELEKWRNSNILDSAKIPAFLWNDIVGLIYSHSAGYITRTLKLSMSQFTSNLQQSGILKYSPDINKNLENNLENKGPKKIIDEQPSIASKLEDIIKPLTASKDSKLSPRAKPVKRNDPLPSLENSDSLKDHKDNTMNSNTETQFIEFRAKNLKLEENLQTADNSVLKIEIYNTADKIFIEAASEKSLLDIVKCFLERKI